MLNLQGYGLSLLSGMVLTVEAAVLSLVVAVLLGAAGALAKTSRSVLIPGHETDTGQIMRAVMEAVERVIVAGADPKASLAKAQKEIDAKF